MYWLVLLDDYSASFGLMVVKQSITPVFTKCHRIHKEPGGPQLCRVPSLVITESDSPREDIQFELLQWSQLGVTLSVENVRQYLQIFWPLP